MRRRRTERELASSVALDTRVSVIEAEVRHPQECPAANRTVNFDLVRSRGLAPAANSEFPKSPSL